MRLQTIQFDLFPMVPVLMQGAEMLELMRTQKWAHGGQTEQALVAIELVPHDGKWMWASSLNSHNGSGQCSKALPKWGRFAESKIDALIAGVDEVRTFMHRATAVEQGRISEWVSQVMSSAQQNNNPYALLARKLT
jgi:hypothetical protein